MASNISVAQTTKAFFTCVQSRNPQAALHPSQAGVGSNSQQGCGDRSREYQPVVDGSHTAEDELAQPPGSYSCCDGGNAHGEHGRGAQAGEYEARR